MFIKLFHKFLSDSSGLAGSVYISLGNPADTFN